MKNGAGNRRWQSVLAGLTAAVLTLGLATAPAIACPMCKNGLSTEDRLPRAYMASILFMLGMPATVFGAFGVVIYRAVRKSEQATLARVAEMSHAGLPAKSNEPA